MQKGGNGVSKETARSVRIINIILAVCFAMYASLAWSGVIDSLHVVPLSFAVAVTLCWIAVSIWYYIHPSTHIADTLIRVSFIHFLILTMMLFVTGLTPIVSSLYIIIALINYIYFERRGLYASLAVLAIATIIDIFLRGGMVSSAIILSDIISYMTVVVATLAIASIIRIQETKHRALVHSQQRERLQYDRLLTIINNITDATFTTDKKGNILMYNAASLNLLDTNASLKGRNIGEVFQLHDKDNKHINLTKILNETSRATRRDDLNHVYSDGESIRLEITYAPIRSNYSLTKKHDDLSGYILIMRDVTKEKSLEEERDEFISVVSHELRTPITIVEGALSNLGIMIQRSEPLKPAVLENAVSTAHDQVLYLAKMVNDLSTLSRAERGVADNVESIPVEALLHDLYHRYQKEANKKHLHLNLDLGVKLGNVSASRLYLEELLQNFITNAIKYTKEGSVTIAAHRNNGIINFSVSDTGIGISRSDQNKVFNKFYRSEDYRIRETSGTGLGLYVSSKLARKLGTHIELKSRLNHGSDFRFSLPVEP